MCLEQKKSDFLNRTQRRALNAVPLQRHHSCSRFGLHFAPPQRLRVAQPRPPLPARSAALSMVERDKTKEAGFLGRGGFGIELMHTSGAQVERILDPDKGNVTTATLQHADALVGSQLRLELV